MRRWAHLRDKDKVQLHRAKPLSDVQRRKRHFVQDIITPLCCYPCFQKFRVVTPAHDGSCSWGIVGQLWPTVTFPYQCTQPAMSFGGRPCSLGEAHKLRKHGEGTACDKRSHTRTPPHWSMSFSSLERYSWGVAKLLTCSNYQQLTRGGDEVRTLVRSLCNVASILTVSVAGRSIKPGPRLSRTYNPLIRWEGKGSTFTQSHTHTCLYRGRCSYQWHTRGCYSA